MLQLSLYSCRSDEVDTISEQLEEWGAVSITWLDEKDSPIYEPGVGELPLWPLVTIQALFEESFEARVLVDCEALVVPRLVRGIQEDRSNTLDPDIQSEHALLSLCNNSFPEKVVELSHLPSQDWVAMNEASFQPFSFGNHCWICPSWIEPTEPNGTNVILDPGLAFGTGSHATTFQCLAWLAETPLKGKTIIDYGCGSGVLAITALLLGAKKAQAIDIDPQAHIATRDNAKRNKINSQQLSCHFPKDSLEPVDIIIANILLRPLMTLTNTFNQLLKPNGVLVVSGLFEDQATLLTEAYDPYFTKVSESSKDGWSLIIFERNASK